MTKLASALAREAWERKEGRVIGQRVPWEGLSRRCQMELIEDMEAVLSAYSETDEAHERKMTERQQCLTLLRNAIRIMSADPPLHTSPKQVRDVDCMFLEMVISLIEEEQDEID